MKQDIIITAKTVEEAMAQAVEKYGSSDVEISYRILDMPKKGFLGIGSTPAKVLVTVGSDDEVELLKSELRSAVRSTAFAVEKSPELPKAENLKTEQKKPDLREQRRPRQQEPSGDAKPAPSKSAAPVKSTAPAKPATPAAPAVRTEPAPATAKAAPQTGAALPVPKPLPTLNAAASVQTAKPTAEQENAPQNAKPSDLREYRPSLERKKAAQNGDAPEQLAYNAPRPPRSDMERQSREQRNDRPPRNDRPRAEQRPDAQRVDAQRVNAPRVDAQRVDAKRPDVQRPAAPKSAAKPYSKPRRRDDDVFDVSPAEMTAALTFINLLLGDMELACTASPAMPIADAAQTTAVTDAAQISVATDAAQTAAVQIDAATDAAQTDTATDAAQQTQTQPAETAIASTDSAAPSASSAAPETERPFLDPSRIINITGVDAAALIGYHGETLDALQYLVNLAVNRKEGERHREYVKIIIDIENYRAKREETLRALARRTAARALKYNRNIPLEPMNPYERRIIHSEVQLIDGVSTHSVGSDENRRIIMTVDALGDSDSYDVRDDAQKKRGGRPHNRRRRSDAPASINVTADTDTQ